MKEAIVNSTAKYPVSLSTIDSANDKITIKGFGSFKEDQVVSAVAQRFQASRLEAMAFTAPTATELGITEINVPVTFSIRVKTFGDASEYATSFVMNSRPLIFEVLISVGDTATLVADKIASAFSEWESKFNLSNNGLPFTVDNTTGVITMTMKDYTLFFQSTIEFKVNRAVAPVTIKGSKAFDTTLVTGTGSISATIPMVDTTGLRVGDTVTIGATLAAGETQVIIALDTDTSITLDAAIDFATGDSVYLHTTALNPTFDGKYLEENVRMSLSTTSDSYGISPDEKPFISGNYATISFVVNDANVGGIDGQYAKHKFLGATRGEIGGTREFKFTLYLLEGSDMWAASAGNKVFDIITWLSGASVAPVLSLADGSIAADAAAWVA